MSLALYRIDDRLIHGQVVVGWGQPLDIDFIVLVDDNVACCDWEQDLYRMGVPPEMQIIFADVESAIEAHDSYVADPRKGILVVPDVTTMERLIHGIPTISEVNLGGIHHRADRIQKLRYLFLAPEEEEQLRNLSARGVKITGRDVPAARIVPIAEILGAPSQQSRSA